MAEEKKHKKFVKVVDIVRVENPNKRIRNHSREADSIRELEEIVASKNKKHEVEKEFGTEKSHESKKFSKKIRLLVFGILIIFIIGFLGYEAIVVMPKANVYIVTKKITWSFDKQIVVNKNINQIDKELLQIPGEVISVSKNTSMSFAPSGKKNSLKASGIVTIFNAYNTSPQKLVATTRLQAPNGNIYRLVEAVTVPGATMVNGKLQPSSVTALAVADQEGESYVSGPISKLTIPGFLGSPRYNGFYASAPSGFKIGSISYVTDEDVAKARDQISKTLNDAMLLEIKTQIPSGFVLRPDSIKATITKLTINKNLDSNGQFSAFAQGDILAMIYKESDLLELMSHLAKDSSSIPQEFQKISDNINYGQPTVDWKLGKMTLPINYSAVYSYLINPKELARTIAGKSETDFKSYILSLPGIDKVSAEFWPFWVSSVTNNPEKIFITVE
jgi:cytoskeletal protein RodZ